MIIIENISLKEKENEYIRKKELELIDLQKRIEFSKKRLAAIEKDEREWHQIGETEGDLFTDDINNSYYRTVEFLMGNGDVHIGRISDHSKGTFFYYKDFFIRNRAFKMSLEKEMECFAVAMRETADPELRKHKGCCSLEK